MIRLEQGDCLEVMDRLISEGVKVDAIITDPPYGTMKGAEKTGIYGSKNNPKHDWDEKIDIEKMMLSCVSLETPPPGRGIQSLVMWLPDPVRNTPAWAGNTQPGHTIHDAI
jgi:tRNA G10  N-methylase Trm11